MAARHASHLIGAAVAVTLAAGCAPTPAPAAQAEAGGFPNALSGLGTEPFWSLEIDGTRLRYTTPENRTGWVAQVVRRQTGDGLELSGTLAGQPLRATIRSGACSDGMSDRRYPYSLAIALGGETLRGCAFPL